MPKKMKRKSGAGRPPLPEDEAKSRKVFFRADPPFYAKLERTAKGQGKPLGTWIYDTLAELLRSE